MNDLGLLPIIVLVPIFVRTRFEDRPDPNIARFSEDWIDVSQGDGLGAGSTEVTDFLYIPSVQQAASA